MAVLPSRKIEPEQFLADFLATLKPGIIKRSRFIPWDTIAAKLRQREDALRFFADLSPDTLKNKGQQVADALLSADDPADYVSTGFEVLGHTQDVFVTFEDNTKISQLSKSIKQGDASAAAQVVSMWRDLGLAKVISSDVQSEFLGVQVGLACNSRKNAGGDEFRLLVKDLLGRILAKIDAPSSCLLEEAPIKLPGSGQKTVDFAIAAKGKVKVAVEVNFYTVSGSKPTEIKRAYADLNGRLEDLGIVLVWITDGVGYKKMKKSLKDAFSVHPNTYNYQMALDNLVSDLKSLGMVFK